MPRPDVDILEQVVHKGNSRAIVRAIRELSIYPIHRVYRDVKTKSAAYTMDPVLDRIILVDASGGAVTITLPDAPDADYTEYVIVAIDTDSGANAVTVATAGSSTINGASTVATSTQYISIRVASNGVNYFRTDID